MLGQSVRFVRGAGTAGTRRWFLIIAAAVLVVLGMNVLPLWVMPAGWIAGSPRVTVATLSWARTHLLTVTVAGQPGAN